MQYFMCGKREKAIATGEGTRPGATLNYFCYLPWLRQTEETVAMC